MVCINKSLLSFMKLKITTNAVSFTNCLQFVLAVASRFQVWICLLNSPWTDGYKIVGFVRKTSRHETLVASCLLLQMFIFDNFGKKWKPDETCVNHVAVHTGSCNVGCTPGIPVSVLYAADTRCSTPLLGKYTASLWWGLKLKCRVYLFSPYFFFLFSFFFFFFLIFSLSWFFR